MRRTPLRLGLATAALVLLSGIGTAQVGGRAPGFKSEVRTVTRSGPVGTQVAPAPRPRRPSRSGVVPNARQTEPQGRGLQRRSPVPSSVSRVPDGPLPVPDMPAIGAEADVAMAADVTPLPMPAPALADDFEALPDNGTAIPPDTHGAAGPTKLMTVLNSQVRVQERDGTPVTTQDLDTFWSSVATAPVFDPRVLYDPDPSYGQGRWLWTAVQGARSASSGILVGVSTSEEPALGYGFLIDLDMNDLVWADYPTIGFNRNWVVVQVNGFRISDDGFDTTYIFAFDKADLYDGPPYDPAKLFYSSVNGGTQVPAATYDQTIDELYLLQRWSSAAGQLRLYKIWDNAGVAALDDTPVFPSTVPWADGAPGGVDFAPQAPGPPGCAAACAPNCRIQTNDSRVQNVVYRAGTLWTTHTVFYPESGPTRSSVQWWQIDTAGNVLQRGLVDDTSDQRFHAFPSIAVNRHGDLLLGYSTFEAGLYAGARYSFRNAFDEVNRLRSDALLKDGEACYYKAPTTRNRWGDYSATVVDPLDDSGLWTIQEYAAPAGDAWGTWWGSIDVTRTLSIADVSVDEGDTGATNLTFTVTLSEPTMQQVTVQWSTADGTATTLDSDYVAVSSTLLTFNPGEKTKTVTVLVNGDVVYEPNETLLVNLATPSGATIADGQGVGTILNDDPVPRISIGDVTAVEGNGGVDTTAFVFPVTLSHPGSSTVTASWVTSDGTAAAGTDYSAGGGTVTFSAGDVSETVTVFVNGDLAQEPDEVFSVLLGSPSGGTILKGTGVGTILDDDAVNPGVQGLVAVSDGNATAGRNRLQWLNPAGGNPINIRVKWETPAGDCTASYPADSSFVGGKTVDVTPGAPGAPQIWDHPSLANGQYYCYAVWVEHSPGGYSTPSTAEGRPFDATAGYIRWKYVTGTTTIPPPTVGLDGVLAPSNDLRVHAMERGPSGGAWPASWSPISLGSPAQQRSPIVPLGGINRAYFTTQDGRVHSVNAKTGALLWSTQLTPGQAEAAPAGIFSAWGGAGDYILVGTSSASGNFFYALDPFTGAVVDQYPGAGDGPIDLGPVLSSASVDYASNRVYFASWPAGSTETLWCLQLGPVNDALSLAWKVPLTQTTGSPTLRGGRLYVGTDDGVVWSVDAATGGSAYFYDTGDPAPIDFVFPDRLTQRLYFSTADSVWGIDDGGASLTFAWEVPLTGSKPSTVLYWPGKNRLYVGLEQRAIWGGGLLEIDTSLADPGSLVQYVELEVYPVVIGPPSLDIGHNLVHVGSAEGILYAVEVPVEPF